MVPPPTASVPLLLTEAAPRDFRYAPVTARFYKGHSWFATRFPLPYGIFSPDSAGRDRSLSLGVGLRHLTRMATHQAGGIVGLTASLAIGIGCATGASAMSFA
ncbi:MAG: hypothetical protein R3E12_05440 [Candidatus Eisenbacteria bacterium]